RYTHTSMYVPFVDLKPYVLFYRNYTGAPYHWNFDHLWSLCVEEHFYILFPLALIILLKIINKPTIKHVYYLCIAAVTLGFLAKVIMLYYSNGKDTYSATHNRIDALAYGVLLCLLANKFKNSTNLKMRWSTLFIGVTGLSTVIFMCISYEFIFFNKVMQFALAPLFFALIIFGTMHINFSKFWLVRFIAYYSYNLYLWHPIVVHYSTDTYGAGYIGFSVYFLVSFMLAFIATVFIEEPFLK
ncbi:MAG: acyltransferase, partial [Bacteroidia bacterium]